MSRRENFALHLYFHVLSLPWPHSWHSQYMNALAFCLLLDLVWLNIASGVQATIDADGLPSQRIPRMVAVGCSVANFFIKLGLYLFLYASGLVHAHVAEIEAESSKPQYGKVATLSPRAAAKAALDAARH